MLCLIWRSSKSFLFLSSLTFILFLSFFLPLHFPAPCPSVHQFIQDLEDVAEQSLYGRTALHLAAARGHQVMVQYILNTDGAEWNIPYTGEVPALPSGE